jgi:hypothetical protein
MKLIVLFSLLNEVAYSQMKVEFHYQMNERINNLVEQPIWGMGHEFKTQRVYYSPLLFSETRLFTGDSTRAILFKTKKGVWYYRLQNTWRLFYNSKKKVGGIISISKINYRVTFRKKVKINNTLLDKFILKPMNISQSHSPIYFFEPQKGVVIIKAGSAILLRSDSFNKSLTDEEINLL